MNDIRPALRRNGPCNTARTAAEQNGSRTIVSVPMSSHLKRRWSPEQIAGSIRHDLHETISHEAIYQYIYAQIHRDGWGLLRPGHKDLRLYLRRRRSAD